MGCKKERGNFTGMKGIKRIKKRKKFNHKGQEEHKRLERDKERNLFLSSPSSPLSL
jgi:hypothetical protein